MEAKGVLDLIIIIISFLVIGLILIQGRGAGLGSAWGGGGEFFQTRRGIEKITFRLTVVVVLIFFIISLMRFLSG